MSALGWIILGIYVISWTGFSVTIARLLARGLGDDLDAVERSLVVRLGMMAGLFWPLVIPGGWVYKRAFSKEGL